VRRRVARCGGVQCDGRWVSDPARVIGRRARVLGAVSRRGRDSVQREWSGKTRRGEGLLLGKGRLGS
jgi:hypothetical protein